MEAEPDADIRSKTKKKVVGEENEDEFFSPSGDAQSSGGQPSVLCAAPAGPMRTSVTTRLSLDGRRFASGPRFYYHDASATTNNNNNNQ